ncbi:hypothetical protein GDO81_018720 [Engystomops pustulosus]|uniref:Uncharacterized protein n=1 Tax=Engystomops pustulosus TaxID=76066 RepID=A0AAV6YIB7_ENGPU|nr:hypothetical protein GDO81_018720 [Engystomops pustulosus]
MKNYLQAFPLKHPRRLSLRISRNMHFLAETKFFLFSFITVIRRSPNGNWNHSLRGSLILWVSFHEIFSSLLNSQQKGRILI